MRFLYFFLAYFVILASLLPFIPSSYWLIRALEFPRYQLLIITIIAFIVLIFIYYKGDNHSIIIAVLLLFVSVYQISKIYPYTFLAKKQVLAAKNYDDKNTISMIIANVLMSNRNSSKFLEIIKQTGPDIILAIETNYWWVDKLKPLEKEYPHNVLIPIENTYGMLLYSKLELVNPKVEYLVENDVPSIHTYIKLRSGDTIQTHFVHPRPPAPTESSNSKERDAELLIVGKTVENSKKPVIIAGDLNDVAWSSTTKLFRKISGLLDPRIGRGFYNTFHADYYVLRWPLDYVFHSNHFKLIKLERLQYFDSDHFPVYINLQLDRTAVYNQEKPQANGEEVQDANKKINNGLKK